MILPVRTEIRFIMEILVWNYFFLSDIIMKCISLAFFTMASEQQFLYVGVQSAAFFSV